MALPSDAISLPLRAQGVKLLPPTLFPRAEGSEKGVGGEGSPLPVVGEASPCPRHSSALAQIRVDQYCSLKATQNQLMGVKA